MTTELEFEALTKRATEQVAELERLVAGLRDMGDVEIAISEELFAPLLEPIAVVRVPCTAIRG